jgi:hypothetical protein
MESLDGFECCDLMLELKSDGCCLLEILCLHAITEKTFWLLVIHEREDNGQNWGWGRILIKFQEPQAACCNVSGSVRHMTRTSL